MKQSTFSAQVANNLLTVLQGYSKTIRLLLVMLLTLTVATNAWGADVVYKTAKFGSSYNSSKVSSYTSSWYSTYDGFRVDIVNANNNNNSWSYIKMGSKNAASTGTITTNAKIDAAITKVSLTIDAITANNITSITLKTATSSNGTYTSVGTFSKVKGTQTVTLASPTANLFYKIEVVCTKGSNNGLIQISQVDYYKSDVVATPEYNITYVGDDHITYSGTKPETITKEDGGFELEFSVNDGYQLDDVQVKMGGQDLVLDEDYLWEEGYLLILPETDITGDVEIIFETVATCTAPTITTQPSAATYTKGATATALKVVVSGTNLTYQWYSNTSNSTNGATKISGATSSTYTPSTSTVGTKYYYCIVSSGSCSTTSNIVSVVVNNPPFTVTLVPGSGSVTSTTLTETSAGAGVTLPTPTLDGCDEWSFAGWTTSSVTNETSSKPATLLTGTYKPTANTTLYAVYQRTEETEGGGTTPVTGELSFSNTNQRTSFSTTEQVWENAGITFTNQKASSTNNVADYSNPIRLYKSSSITITAPGNITKIQFNCISSYIISINGASTSGTTVTVTLNGTSDTYTISQLSAQVRLSSLSVTYTSAGGTITTTYYHSTPDCGGDDPEPTGYTITFEANGGTKIDKIENATTLPTSLPTTTRDHYTFAGWFTNEGCTQAATAGAPISDNVTLYAKWTPVTYTVTFDAGSGTYTSGDIQGNFETGLELPTATPCTYAQENGWSFVGWSESTVSETTIRPVLHTGTYKPTKDIKLHAVYAKTGTSQGGANEFILSLQHAGTTYYVGQTFSDGKLSAETEQANAARFTIEDNYLHYEGGYISHKTTNANLSKVALKDSALVWSINESDSISFTSTVANTRGLAFNYNNGNPRFAAYVLDSYPHKFVKKSVSGGDVQVTTYNSNPSCEAPVDPNWVAATITHTAIKANCGSTTVLGATGENGPATISFSGTDLQNSVTVTASDGFLVSTDKTAPEKYAQSVIIYPNSTGSNIGKITQGVHVIAQAPAQSGNYDGTITLTGNDIPGGSQVIEVIAAVTCTQYTITWSVNGDNSHQETYSPGDALQLPEIDITPCDGMNHVGWTDNMGYVHGTNILFTETTDMTVTSDKTYYAVFAASTSSGGGEITLDFSSKGYTNAQEITSVEQDDITVRFDKGTNNNNPPKYYASGEAVRAYGGNTFTVSSGNTISKIVITFGSSDGTNEITTDSGDYSDGTWTGSANNITFTIGGSSGNRRIKSIAVTSAGGGASYYTGHTTTCSGSQQLATPTNLQATDITYNGATLTWDAVAGANKYKVVINGTEYISNTNSYTTHDLKQQTAYTWTIQAIGNGTTFTDSEISAEATFTTGVALVITWSVSTVTSTTTITKGQPIGANLKTPATPAACEGKYFMGWSASSTVNSDGSDFTPITSATVPETNVTYYAVFAEPTGNSGAQGELFSESFETIEGSGGNDGKWDGNIASAQLTEHGNWVFTYAYKGNECIKLGKASGQGEATTPALGISGNATLTFAAGAWNGSNEQLTINLQIVGEGSIEPSSVTLTKGQFTTYTANITGANADTKVKFSAVTASNNRFFLDEVKVSGGTGNTSYTDYSTSCGTYTVTFYGFNNGEYTTICNDNPAVDEVEQGGTYVIPNCEPAYDPQGLGRTFAGTWNTKANGKGTAYKPSDEIVNVSEDITLYAQWKLETTGDIELPADKEDLATTDVVVTGGTTLTLQAGTTTINSLTLKGGLQENGTYAMPVVNIPKGATLVRNNNKINLDLKVNNSSYYPFAVPFEVENTAANVNYINPTLKEYANANQGYGKYYRILEYNGALRAEKGVNSDENWVHVGRTDVKLMPGKGYAISAVPAAGDDTVTIRITMTVDNAWLANGEQESITVKEQTTTRNQIAVTAYTGAAADKDLCNAGWNFVANPYLTNFTTNNHITGVDYIGGEIIVSNGQFVKDGTEVPYVTIPNANMSWYEQCRVEDAILSPMYSFFVQIAEGVTMTFTTDGRQQAPAALRASSEQANPSFEADIVILNNQEQTADHTGLVINDRWSPAYEIGGDLEKMFGNANKTAIYTLSGNTRLAYNALSYNDALVAIPIGFCAQADGEYTIQLSNTEDIVGVECIELKDLYNNQTTNLLYTDYTFYSDATQEDSRFVVYIVPQKNTPTDISTIINGNSKNRKIIFNNHLYIIHNGNIYNGAGQMVK